ncbi:hypothetical protein GmHk_04G010520 [Glycine max]|nr:hypothetical protein GmHk_04G010520 [Glycine max]
MELHELRNDTCFLSVMSRNFTDYATVPSLAFGMLRNFTDCTIMLPFDSRHVAELHGLPNDGCQVPRSGHAKVASQQTDGPRTKLGKIGEKLAAQLAQASKVASSRRNNLLEESSGGLKWAWLLFTPPVY